jgi:exopolysaccharide production protein ExoQ
MHRWPYWLSGAFFLSAIDGFGCIDRLKYGSWPGKSGDIITRTLNILLILEALTLFSYSYLKGGKPWRGTVLGSNLALALVGFLFLTAFWSMDGPATVRVASVYLFVVLGAIGIARILDPDEFMHLVSSVCFITAIASLLLAVISPANAYASGGYEQGMDFIGIFPHKNVLGQTMATGVLACLHCIRVSRRRRATKIVMLLLFISMAVASKSTAAWLITLVFCAIGGFFAVWQKGGPARFLGSLSAVIVAPVLVIMIVFPDSLLEMIGKDPTLTGRTEIWAFVIDDIWMKPLLGWGYFGFWLLNNPAAIQISDAVHWTVPQAHNGLLELLLNLGLLGTAAFISFFIRNLALAVRCLRTPANVLAVSTIMCCVGLLMQGVSEIVLLVANEPLTPVFFVAGLMCERAVWVGKRQRFRPQQQRYQLAVQT